MPFTVPREITQQTAYNRKIQAQFDSTRRVAPPVPAAAPTNVPLQLRELAQMRSSGALTEPEFQAAKRRVLGT